MWTLLQHELAYFIEKDTMTQRYIVTMTFKGSAEYRMAKLNWTSSLEDKTKRVKQASRELKVKNIIYSFLFFFIFEGEISMNH